jgi:hypothetical protein
LSGSAGAAKTKGRISPAPDRGAETVRAARRLARSISVNRRWVERATFSTLPPFGDPAAISTKRLAGFPRHGRSYAILANGDVKLADDRNSLGDTSRQLGGPTIRGARDVLIHRTVLNVPRGRSCLSIRFRFLTEEYPEWVGENFNDAFIAELDASEWSTSGKGRPQIVAPGNFAFDSKRNLISVNGAGDATVTKRRARGTTYDGATRLLRASTPITSGDHILYLSIFDQGDRDYDSAVFVDRLTLDNRRPCRPGAVRDLA